MSDRSGLSRGDRNRNARLARLRQLLPFDHAIVGIDLADDKQAAVVTDHDSRVIARRRVNARAWELGDLLDWAAARASAAGFASVTVACEPTGHRWRVLDQIAAGRGAGAGVRAAAAGLPGPRGGGLHPQQDRRHRRGDHRPAGQRAALLRARARGRGVGAAAAPRGAPPPLTTDATAQASQIRDLLECAWPAVLGASGSPFGVGELAGGADRGAGPVGATVTWAASSALALPGSRARSAASCPGWARPARACGSCGLCSTPPPP